MPTGSFLLTLAAAGIAEMSEEDYDGFAGALESCLGWIICICVGYSMLQTWLTKGRFGTRLLIWWTSWAALGLYFIQLSRQIANQ